MGSQEKENEEVKESNNCKKYGNYAEGIEYLEHCLFLMKRILNTYDR